ncbi:Calcium uniporter protein 4, mitochondrial-like protein [Drosera capensis]
MTSINHDTFLFALPRSWESYKYHHHRFLLFSPPKTIKRRRLQSTPLLFSLSSPPSMALRAHLAKRRSIFTASTKPPQSLPRRQPAAADCESNSSTDHIGRGIFRRFLPSRATSHAAASTTSSVGFPEVMTVPTGEKLRKMMMSSEEEIGGRDDRMIRFGELDDPMAAGRIGVEDVRRILRVSMMERLKEKLRGLGSDTVSYGEFVRICVDECGSETQGMEFARLLDQSGNVIVFGDLVILRPQQVVMSMETLLSQSIVKPNDPRRAQLDELEKQKAQIDREAQSMVQRELYCGLGLFAAQTLGFMRLTFWDLCWDVMEPICYFVTSLHFVFAYGFFLRTSTEPSFEGYYRRRFNAKQMKLMKLHNFDVDTYDRLRRAFYPKHSYCT